MDLLNMLFNENSAGDNIQKQAEAMGDTMLGVRDGKASVDDTLNLDAKKEKEGDDQPHLLATLSKFGERIDLNSLGNDNAWEMQATHAGADR